MLGKAELERLRPQKERLVLQSDTSRRVIVAELQRLRSPGFWRTEAGQVVRQHPLLTAMLGIGGGIVAIKALRQPGAALGWLGRLGGVGSALFSVWNWLGRR
jgi:hypothetical protein